VIRLRLFAAIFVAAIPLFGLPSAANANCVNPGQEAAAAAVQQNASTEPVVVELNTCGGDDRSYQIPLSVDVTFDGVVYSNIYATTNSVITFGRPDGTYWTYPSTPSISLYSFDWVVYPQWRNDEHLIIRSSNGGFQVDISARPIWLQSATEPTRIVITAAILSDGSVAMAYTLSGPEYPEYNPRTGVRLNDGTVVDFETYGIQETEEAPELAPEPTEEAPFNPPAPEPTPEPTPTTTEEVDREPAPEPTPTQTPPFIPEGASVAQEGSTFEVVAPEGQRVANVTGYYGDPNDSTRGEEVSSLLFDLIGGETSVTIEVSNETFGSDPAPGTPKVLILLIVYEDIPIETSPEIPAPSPTPITPETPIQTPTPTPSEPEPVAPIVPPTTSVVPEPEPSLEPAPQPQPQPQPQETTPPTQSTTPPVAPSPKPSPELTPPVVEPEIKPITSVEELPIVISPAQLMQVDLTQIVATDLTEAQADALVKAALETFETAEQGSPEYQQALEALFVAAQQDDIVLDESLAAIPLLGDVLGGATELINFLGNAGSDMSPQVRETSEKIVVTAVIVAQIVGVSTFAAMASTSRQ
jgi:outer membrane biosynthesis protein TonB